MDEESYEEFNKGKNNLVFIVVFSLITLGIILGLFTTPKQEILICNKSNGICYVEKTNLINFKYKKKLINISKITGVSYISQRVKGNRYAKGYTSYYLVFVDKNNNHTIIFTTDYYDRDELNIAIKNLKKQIKNNDKIILKRN